MSLQLNFCAFGRKLKKFEKILRYLIKSIETLNFYLFFLGFQVNFYTPSEIPSFFDNIFFR